jgi:hypothetical protein
LDARLVMHSAPLLIATHQYPRATPSPQTPVDNQSNSAAVSKDPLPTLPGTISTYPHLSPPPFPRPHPLLCNSTVSPCSPLVSPCLDRAWFTTENLMNIAYVHRCSSMCPVPCDLCCCFSVVFLDHPPSLTVSTCVRLPRRRCSSSVIVLHSGRGASQTHRRSCRHSLAVMPARQLSPCLAHLRVPLGLGLAISVAPN